MVGAIVHSVTNILKRNEKKSQVKYSHSVNIIYYCYKYLYKGKDGTQFIVADDNSPHVDEINQYIAARYLSASEATWRIFGFDNHGRTPSVTALPVHLPGQSAVIFEEGQPQHNLNDQKSALERYFCRPTDKCFDHITYQTYYERFAMRKGKLNPNSSKDQWLDDHANPTKRKLVTERRAKAGNPDHWYVTRLQVVMPQQRERYFVRWLLNHRAARGFEDLKTVEGVPHSTFEEAAVAMGYAGFQNDADRHIQDLVDSQSAQLEVVL